MLIRRCYHQTIYILRTSSPVQFLTHAAYRIQSPEIDFHVVLFGGHKSFVQEHTYCAAKTLLLLEWQGPTCFMLLYIMFSPALEAEFVTQE